MYVPNTDAVIYLNFPIRCRSVRVRLSTPRLPLISKQPGREAVGAGKRCKMDIFAPKVVVLHCYGHCVFIAMKKET